MCSIFACSLCLEGEMARDADLCCFMETGQQFGQMVRDLKGKNTGRQEVLGKKYLDGSFIRAQTDWIFTKAYFDALNQAF